MNSIQQDLLGQFDAGTAARGVDYARQGKVIGLRRSGNDIAAETAGSGGAVYRQSIRLRAGKQGVRIEGDCSCPVSFNCKHVVAVLLVAMAQEEVAVAAHVAHDGLSAAATTWLAQVDSLQEAASGRAAAPADTPSALAFVLIPDKYDGVPNLHACRTRVARNGDIAGVALKDDVRDLLTLPPDWMRSSDEDMLRQLVAVRAGRGTDLRPAGALAASLLERLCAQERLLFAHAATKFQSRALYPVVAGPQRRGALAWRTIDEDGGMIALRWRFDDGADIDFVLPTVPPFYLAPDAQGRLSMGRFDLADGLTAIEPIKLVTMVAQAPALLPHERAPMAQRLSTQGLDRILPLPHVLETRRRSDIVPTPVLRLGCEEEWVRGTWQQRDVAQIGFDYDGVFVDEPDEPELRRMAGDILELIERNEGAERAVFETLASLGFRARSPATDVPWMLQLSTPTEWLAFTRRDLPRLREAGWDIEFDDYRYDVVEPEEWIVELQEEGDGIDAWFSLELGIVIDGERHALLPILLGMIRRAPDNFDAAAIAARDDDSEFMVEVEKTEHTWDDDADDTLRIVLPWKRIKPILVTLGELYFGGHAGERLRLPALDAARLAELESVAQLRWMGGERLRALGRKLNDFDGIRQVPAPAGLQAQLRAYQLAGLSWMQFLREYGFGGILADDMGLGKTIQTLAHILVEKEAGRLDAPALVVAPTSLMGNWQDEAARFAPGLRVLLLHGKDRASSFERIPEADLVLTTYALLGRDEEALRRHRYHLLILDEAQYIKNHRARAAQVACLLDARHRLCLTGTPVQNHLGELWSQFHFLMPGLLGDDKAFRRHFRNPIEQGGDVQRAHLLTRRLKPFMLRRTKDKVATELPPKTEIVLHVDAGAAQRDLYETVRLAMDRRVRDEIDRKGLARSQIVILDALLKLRQVCCDPRLLDPASSAGSAKLEALLELLETLRSEGRKVLVFSQFTSMLALVGAALKERAIDFALLTGETEDRAAQVAAFQQGRVDVFLISLKAGGVGLNLTAADTVVHYDPWWNPASENQATDRAWRIGQDQPVFVYKLIVRGTLEEKIQDMQRRKGELAAAVLAPEGGLAQAIGPGDLRVLLEGT
nr:DEAD/DEAH box helicase [uncultured Massilia sp.]